jgi:hypothetical protein
MLEVLARGVLPAFVPLLVDTSLSPSFQSAFGPDKPQTLPCPSPADAQVGHECISFRHNIEISLKYR